MVVIWLVISGIVLPYIAISKIVPLKLYNVLEGLSTVVFIKPIEKYYVET